MPSINENSGLKIDSPEQITDDFLLMQGRQIYDNAKTGHQLFFERMRKDMDMYDGYWSTEERKVSDILGIPRLFIPKTYVNTQRILVEVLETLMFDQDNLVSIKSDKMVSNDYLQIVQVLMNHRLNSHPINFYVEAYEAILNAVRNMICCVKVYPRIETEKKLVRRLKDQKLEDGTKYQTFVDEKMDVIKHFEPVFECVPPEDVFFSKRSTWKNYWKYPLVHRFKITRDEATRLGYKNVDVEPEVQLEDQLADVVKYERRRPYQTLFNDQTNVRAEEEIWAFEVWDFMPSEHEDILTSGSYVLLGDMLEPHVVGRDWIENDLPYKFSPFEHNRPPIILGEAYPEPHRLEGKSYPQITEALQKETNAQRNQEREAIARDLRRSMYVNREANVDLVALTNRRIGGYVLGDGPREEAVGEIPTNNSAAILARTQQRTDNDYYETGLPPNLLGNNTQEETATGSTQQLTNANKKISLVIKNLAYTCFLPAFKYLLRLEQAYETDDYIKKVTGKYLGWRLNDSNIAARMAIQGDFDMEINLGMNKQSQINQYLLVADRINQTNQAMMQLVQARVANPQQVKFQNPLKLFQELLPILGFNNIHEFELQAMAPPPEQGEQPGIPSPPANVQNPTSQVSNMSPQAPGGING